jgi:hypothetical protein
MTPPSTLNRSTRLLALALSLVAGSFFSVSAQAKVHLKISANTLISDSFAKWTAETPWDQIKKFDHPAANRGSVELVLELQALKSGGLDFDYEVTVVPNYERAKLEVVQGTADLTAETVWDDEIAEHAGKLLKTEPIVRDGEFEKGIYVLPTNDKILHVSTLEALRSFVGATVSTWALDVKTLDAMGLKGVEKAPKAENLYLMVQKQRADFTLLEFSSAPDMSSESGGVRLVPVPNCKIALKGARSWIVAKSSAQSKEIADALNVGVKKLRDDGTITRAYKECGFFHPKTGDWKRLF